MPRTKIGRIVRRAHALEMGGNPDKDPPFFFTKPPDAAVDVSAGGAVVHFPPETEDLQHEVEMVVAIGRGGGALYDIMPKPLLMITAV